MPCLAALVAALLTAATCRAATHTVYWAAATGGAYYAFPSSQSLDDWTTYRVLLSEGVGANVGRYAGSLDDAHGTSWFLFSGAAQPASWGVSVGATTLVVKSNAVQIEDADATEAINAQADLAIADANLALQVNLSEVMGEVDTLLGRLSGARAAYLDYLATIYGKLPSSNIAGVGDVGTTQPRVNKRAGQAYRLRVSARTDGTYTCVEKVRLRPGAVNDIAVELIMSGLHGDAFVEDVASPVVSGGSITCTVLGPRDQSAMVELDGTATAGEKQTVTVSVKMETGERELVTFDVWVTAG